MQLAPRDPDALQDAALDLEGLAAPALRTFFRIADAWELDSAQAMAVLGVPRSTYFKWKRDPASARISRDTLERLSYVFGIYKALELLFPEPGRGEAWLRRPNLGEPFGGRPAIERMISGNVADLYVVRKYLDGVRG